MTSPFHTKTLYGFIVRVYIFGWDCAGTHVTKTKRKGALNIHKIIPYINNEVCKYVYTNIQLFENTKKGRCKKKGSLKIIYPLSIDKYTKNMGSLSVDFSKLNYFHRILVQMIYTSSVLWQCRLHNH